MNRNPRCHRPFCCISRLLWAAALLLCVAIATSMPACAGVQQLVNDPHGEPSPQINSAGQVAWLGGDGQFYLWDGSVVRRPIGGHGSGQISGWQLDDLGQIVWRSSSDTDSEIYLWNGFMVQQLSNHIANSRYFQINASGQVLWDDGGQIFLWDGEKVQRLNPSGSGIDPPQINRSGQVAWQGLAQIYLWDGSAVRQISQNPPGHFRGNYLPQINDHGQVAWAADQDSNGRRNIFLWDGSIVRQLSPDGGSSSEPRISDAGSVVWLTGPGDGANPLFLWSGSGLRRLNGENERVYYYHVNRVGQVVWYRFMPFAPLSSGIYLWDGASVRQLANSLVEADPHINDTGQVVWRWYSGTTYDINLWDGSSVCPITNYHPSGNFSVTLTNALIDLDGQVVWVKDYHELYLYQPGDVGPIQFDPAGVTGGRSSVGTLSLTRPAPAGEAMVTLTSDNPAVAAVPAKILVPAGASSAPFPVTTSPVTDTTCVRITASVEGAQRSTLLRVLPRNLAEFALSQVIIDGYRTTTAAVLLSEPAPAGAAVALSSDHPAVVAVPASVAVPAGGTQATFTLSTFRVAAPTEVVLSATYHGTTRRARIQVVPAAAPLVRVSPDSRSGGALSTGTVSLLDAAPPGGAVIMLSSDNPAAVTVPASVLVASGKKTASFLITTHPVAVTSIVHVSATWQGSTGAAALTVLAAGLTAVTITPSPVPSGLTATGMVTLSAPAPAGGAYVQLASDPSSAPLWLPDVIVPAGATVATFPVTAYSPAGTTTETIVASYAGLSRRGAFRVGPPEIVSVALKPSSLIGGTVVIGTVMMSAPPQVPDARISLSSSDPALVTIPSTVLASGEPSITFFMKTRPVTVSSTVIISASQGEVTRTATLTLLPPQPPAPAPSPGLSALTLDPGIVVAGSPVTGTVKLDRPAPSGGAAVTLASSDPAKATVPAQITVPAGANVVTFTVITSHVATAADLLLSASYAGITQKAALRLLATPPISLHLSTDLVTGSVSLTGTVALFREAPAGGIVVTLASDNPIVVVPASVAVAPGQSAVTFSIATRAVTAATTVTLSASSGGETQSSQITVVPVGLKALTLSLPRLRSGDSAPGVVTLSGPAPAGGVVVTLASSNAAAGVPASITIAAGATTAVIPIAGSFVATPTTATITATYADVTRAATLTVRPRWGR